MSDLSKFPRDFVIRNLLVCLTEECSEVSQAACKALRFRLDDGYPGTDRTNLGDISHELDDIRAIVELLNEYGIYIHTDKDRIEAKKKRVIDMMEYSIRFCNE